MTLDTPRDFRAHRLAEYRTVYEFSAIYLIPFAWLLWRINTPAFLTAAEDADPIMCTLLTVVTLYGFVYGFYAKGELLRANANDNPKEEKQGEDASSHDYYEGPILPSTLEYQAQAQLYLTGNIAINGLACLFLPFAWTLCVRGTDWWLRV